MGTYSKKVKGNYPEKYPKSIKSKDEEGSYVLKCPAWSFSRSQCENCWKLTPDVLTQALSNSSVFHKLTDFEKMTWQSIRQQTHGQKNKSSNHYIEDIDKLHPAAKARLLDLGIDSIFSLRLGSKQRIFGVLSSQVLEIMWFDTEHEIYPIDKE